MKAILITLLIGLAIFTTSCKDEGPEGPMGPRGYTGAPGPRGPAGPGIDDSLKARTYEFILTFDEFTSMVSYSGISDFEKGDMLITYMNPTLAADNWTILPYIFNGVIINSVFSETNGKLNVFTAYMNGSTQSPWADEVNIPFKVLLIKSSERYAHPNLDFDNYYQVKETYGL